MVLPHDDRIMRASASRDGRIVLTASRQGTLKIWQVSPRSSQLVGTIALPRNSGFSFLKDAVIAPDGNTVVAIREYDGAPLVARWRDSGTPEPVLPLSRPTRSADGLSYYFSSLAVSPDGREVAAGSLSNEVVVWDLATGKVIRTLPRLGTAVTAVAYVGTAGQLAVASTDGVVRIWAPGQQRPRLTLELPTRPIVRSISVSPDQRWLVATSEDHALRIWRLTDGHVQAELAGPMDSPAGIGFSPDGLLLAVGASDAAVHVYDWRAKRELGAMSRHGGTVNDVRFLDDGRILSASDDGTAALYPCTVCQPTGEELVRQAEARVHRTQQP
jgi:WD40 repeat protein